MTMAEIQNAKIVGTMLGYEDHGVLTAMVTLDFGGSVQGFGGYFFQNYNEVTKRQEGTAFGVEFIASVLKTVGVDTWEQLKGQHVRVDRDGHEIRRIGHLIENKWFTPKALAAVHFGNIEA
jgi:hypothetical protein